MAVPLYTVKNLDEYWERTAYWLGFHESALQSKAEYGCAISERGVQNVVLSTARKLAKAHRLNIDIVSLLCLATGRCFPDHGHAEMAVIKDDIRKNRADVPLDTFEVDTIEYGLDHQGNMVTPQLDELLRKYFAEDESVAEVNLVRFLQKYLNMNRDELKEISIYEAGKVIDGIMDRAVHEYETSYRLLPDFVPPAIPPHIREQIIRDFRIYTEQDERRIDYIYGYIWI